MLLKLFFFSKPEIQAAQMNFLEKCCQKIVWILCLLCFFWCNLLIETNKKKKRLILKFKEPLQLYVWASLPVGGGTVDNQANPAQILSLIWKEIIHHSNYIYLHIQIFW